MSFYDVPARRSPLWRIAAAAGQITAELASLAVFLAFIAIIASLLGGV